MFQYVIHWQDSDKAPEALLADRFEDEGDEMLKLSKQRTDQLARQVGFPAPVVTLAGGRVWDKSEIQAWMREVGR
jgi:hypothetical protein